MKLRRILLCVLFTIILFGLTAVCVYAAESPYGLTLNAYGAADAAAPDAVAIRYAAEKYYLFLPGAADRSEMTVWYDGAETLTFNGTPVESGSVTNAFAANTVTVSGSAGDYSVRVLQATSAAVFITTESGSMDAVNADKEYKDPGSVVIVDDEGNLQYSGALDYIKGRGNSTWELDKKPYNIKLNKKANLFGMGKSKKWCLLAGFTDDSKLRNCLGYDYSKALGNALTSDVVLADLYCNGEYMGAYSLTEKVEIGENRIDIYDLAGATEDVNDRALEEYPLAGSQTSRAAGTYKYANIPNNPADITGGYLLELEKPLRYLDEPCGFVSPCGQPVVVKEPEYASQKQVKYIYNYYSEFEEALYSATGYNEKGKHYTDYIDADELALAYIIQEMTENFDGCSSSFYLYKDTGDAKFHIGPTWDLDLSLGRGFLNTLITPNLDAADPNVMYVYSTRINNTNAERASLLGQALNHSDFIAKVKTLWATVGHAKTEQMLGSVDAKSDLARGTVIMDAMIWNTFGAKTPNAASSGYTAHISALKSFIVARTAFMDNYLSPDTGFVRYDTLGTAKPLVFDRTVYTAGGTATMPDATPVKSGLTLAGWTETPGGTEVRYAVGSAVEVGGGKVLYPVWQGKEMSESTKNFFQRILAFFAKIREFFRSLFQR
ncbi:MAG: CotH kinase family protein [Clostridia bacterium]|nr:CotH kinase family protein [Clostridia bacterium]